MIRIRAWGLAALMVSLQAPGYIPGVLRAQTPANFDLLPSEPDRPVEITAESLSYNADTGWAEAFGNVEIVSGSEVLRADQVRVNQQTGDVEASGNIVLDRGPGGIWRGESLKYNIRTGEGLTSESEIASGVFKINSEEVRRMADSRILLHDATITSCTNAPGHEHYQVRGRVVELLPGEHFTVRGASLRLFGLPVMYLPYWHRNLNRNYGLRLEPGYSSRMGAFLLASYKARWADFGPDAYVDGRTRLDYRTLRGFAAGQDILWFSPDTGDGLFSIYYLDDKEPPVGDETGGAPVDPERYRAHVEHAAQISGSTRLMLRASYLSDTQVERDFFESEYRRRREPDNHLALTYTSSDLMGGVLFRLGLNDFYSHVDRLPELWLDGLSREVFSTGLFYESSSRLGLLQRRWAERLEAEDYDAFRMDTEHLLYYPTKQFGFLSFVPRAGGRLTYYSDTKKTTIETVPGSVTTNEFGEEILGETLTRSVVESGGADVRSIVEVGAEASFRAYRPFYSADGSAWRHVVEPYADYTLRPEPSLTPDKLYQFDDIDALDEKHDIAFGLRNYLQTRTDGRVRNVLDLDVYSTYRFEYPSTEDAIDQVFLDAIFRPSEWIRLDSDSLYSLSESELKRVDTRLSARRDPAWSIETSHYYQPDINNLLATGATYAPNRAWEFYLYGRYEYENSELEEVGSYVQYSWDCMAVRLIGSYMPGYTNEDGFEEDDDFRVRLNVWLTAFPPDNLNDHYRH